MKRVVSVSLGSSKRDKTTEVQILGEDFRIERIGTDGDMQRFAKMFCDLDGQVDALGVGGSDIYLVVGEKRYAFREILNCVRGATHTPVVDGSGLKHTLERETIQRLQRDGVVDFATEHVLLMSAVDRYGMAQALDQLCPNVIYGDLMFGVGLNIPIHKYAQVLSAGSVLLPIITKLPFKWFYPTGEKQEKRTPKYAKAFDWATTIAGDSLYIFRYAPDRLDGKTIITQSVRKANMDWLRTTGLKQLITTTPVFGGETFATNVMEGVLVALMNKPRTEITEQDYLSMLGKLAWKPEVITF